MPRFGPIRRRELIEHLRILGFVGPYSGGRHQFMMKDNLTLHIPNPHQSDIGRDLLARLLRQAKITKEQWESL